MALRRHLLAKKSRQPGGGPLLAQIPVRCEHIFRCLAAWTMKLALTPEEERGVRRATLSYCKRYRRPCGRAVALMWRSCERPARGRPGHRVTRVRPGPGHAGSA